MGEDVYIGAFSRPAADANSDQLCWEACRAWQLWRTSLTGEWGWELRLPQGSGRQVPRGGLIVGPVCQGDAAHWTGHVFVCLTARFLEAGSMHPSGLGTGHLPTHSAFAFLPHLSLSCSSGDAPGIAVVPWPLASGWIGPMGGSSWRRRKRVVGMFLPDSCHSQDCSFSKGCAGLPTSNYSSCPNPLH